MSAELCYREAVQTPAPILKQLRLDAGLSVEAIARRIGVPRQTLRNWEEQERQPPFEVFDPWAAALGARLEVVVAPAGDPVPDALSPRQRELVTAVLQYAHALDDTAAGLLLGSVQLAARPGK